MTCTLAITDGKKVILAGDSAAVGGKELRLRADTKVFQNGSYGIGFTTSFRMGQILRYETELPEPPPGLGSDELERFLVTEVIPVIRQSFADHGFAKSARFNSPGEPNITEEGQDFGGLFLLGVAGQIFEIRQDYHLARPAAPFSAVGAGAPIALGALHALQEVPHLSLRDRANLALESAEAYSSAVRAPYHFVELPPMPALALC